MQVLRERYIVADPEEQKSLQVRADELRMETQVMSVLIGAVTGLGGTALAHETLAAASEEMRKITIANSKIFDGIVDLVPDDATALTNISGESAGGKWDLAPIKTGGTRVDLDGICGKSNERCATNSDGSLKLNEQKQVIFTAGSLAKFLASALGQEMAGLTGGIQGIKGTLFGIPYAAESWQDKLIEAFGGSHDLIGGSLSGLYDADGNIKRGMTAAKKSAYDKWAAAAILPATPFAMATLLPPEMWKAISILLGTVK